MSKLNQIAGLIDDLRTVPDATLSRRGCLILADLIEELQTENERLAKGIDRAIYHLANEDIYDVYVVDQIRMELVRLLKKE
jgi:hypothetical protein